MNAERTKHTAQYHLKQMDKIAKTGNVPDCYAKYFKGIKNPRSHIRGVNSDIAEIDRACHKEHVRKGEEYNAYCEVCKSNGKPPTGVVGDAGEEEVLTDDSSAHSSAPCELSGIKPTPVSPKRKPKETVEPEVSDTEDDSGVEVEWEEGGKKTLMTLKRFKGLFGAKED